MLHNAYYHEKVFSKGQPFPYTHYVTIAVLCAKVRASDRNPCLLEGLCMRYLANLMVEFFQRYVYSPKMFSAIVILSSLEVRLRDDIWLSFVRVYGLKVYTSYK